MMMMIMMSESQAQAAEDELATLRNKNAALRRQLQRRTGAATKRSTWKPHSLHPIPLDTPPLLEPKDILFVRDSVLQWLGVHSWVLRLGKAERKMLTKQELTIREERYQEFCDNYTASSLHLLHHDIYMALKRLLGKSLMVVAGLIAAAAASIMRGPDHSSMDPDKAFKHWDTAVASLLQVGNAVLTPERLGAIMMYASLHSSAKDTYYSAFMRLNLRPNVKPILIVQTPPPMPPLLTLLTWTIRTRTDPYILMVFAMLK
jgi:hypothetical protein